MATQAAPVISKESSRRRLALGVAPRIVGLVALTALISGGLIAYLGVRNSRGALGDQILLDSQSQADLAAEFARTYVEAARVPLTRFLDSASVRLALSNRSQADLEQALDGLRASMPAVEEVVLFDPNGDMMARSASASPPSANVSTQGWFVNVRSTRTPYLGLASTDVATGRPIISIILPALTADGELAGVLNAGLSLDSLANSFGFLASDASEVSLVDRREGGIVLAHRDARRIMQPAIASETARDAMLAGVRTSLVSGDAAGVERAYAITPVDGLPWTVVFDKSRDTAFASVDDLTRDTLLLAVLVTAVGCLLSGVVALQITRPLSRLRRAAQRLAAGDRSSLLNLRQRDEIGELGRAFDAMSQAIEESTGSLQSAVQQLQSEVRVRQRAEAELRKAHDELEARVQERTAVLKLANESLEESEERFRLLVNGVYEYALFFLDEEGNVVSWNPSGERVMGYPMQEILGRNCSTFFTAEARARGDPKALMKQAREVGSSSYEDWRVRKDGSTFWASVVTTALYDDGGRLKGFAKIVRDMTEQRDAAARLTQSEEHFRSIVERSLQGMIIIDAAGRIQESNAAAGRMFGYEPDELVGRPVENLLPMDLRQRHARYRESFIRAPQPRPMGIGQDLQGLHKDGHEFYVEVSLTPLHTPDGLLVVATVKDITASKLAEAELERHAQELARSNAELEQFAYVASHDLQEPLRMVANYTQLLARRYQGKLDEDADTFIGFAVEGARRMQQLINDLLEYSRVGSRGKDLAPVDMETALNRALANLHVSIQENAARIKRGRLPSVVADEVQVVQVLQNLIANAIKFHADLAPIIEVGSEPRGDQQVFWVRDNGIGIDPQYFDRIFVLFQRLHTRDDYAGTGIGLAVCKRIVERHGGRIWVESRAGEGATFYFTLRAQAPEAASTSQLAAGRVA